LGKLFNTHIGIFGNTGSGKSNTLTKIYTELFEQKAANFAGRSKFSILDFNGEYTGNQLISANKKKVYNLKTGQVQGDSSLSPLLNFGIPRFNPFSSSDAEYATAFSKQTRKWTGAL
jgi:DNA helicase HerA-like ATPase